MLQRSVFLITQRNNCKRNEKKALKKMMSVFLDLVPLNNLNIVSKIE